MTNMPEVRDGFALPVALLAMMIIGAIVTGGFYAAAQEDRVSISTDLGAQAAYVAEYGLDEVLGTWNNEDMRDAVEEPASAPVDVYSGSEHLGSYLVSVRSLGGNIYVISSEGHVAQGDREAVRRVGMVVRPLRAALPTPTALAVYGGLRVGGSSLIRGNDSGGPGCAITDTVAGVTAYDSTLIDDGNKDRISGDPPIAENTALDTSGLSRFGSLQLSDLIAAATKVYEPGESELGMAPTTRLDSLGGTTECDTSVRSNWGDPDGEGPCANEFPIIYAKGDLHLRTGTGQGILIVQGDLQASGNFDFYGVVIVLGELQTTGTGNHIEGSVIVQGDGLLDSESTSLGNSLVQYSRCRVDRAFDATLRPRPLSKRSWIDFSAATRAEIGS